MDVRRLAVTVMLALASTTAAFAQAGNPQQQPPPPAKPEEQQPPPIYEEQIVVTASKVEQKLVNAPATVSVVTADVIASTPSTNYAELLRTVPGVNIVQTSARDFNITTRGATSTLATSQLALLDGRSLYLDFFGFIAWDLLPVNPTEIKQIEVIRGPASAVWGANAMSGVINFISKTPREMAGNSVTLTLGGFDGDAENGQKLGMGSMFGFYGTHARAINDRWAYKVSAGGYTSDPLPRPTGTIPNATNTPYPPYTNQGTTQPKFDGRADYDAPNGKYKLTFAGGYGGTDGIIQTGIGPFDITGLGLSYGTVRFTKNAFKANFFTNILDGDASALLAVGLNGQPVLFTFKTQTYDFEVGNISAIGTRNVVSYGGTARFNNFDLSIAPAGSDRQELGGYVQDELFLNQYVRLNIGARLDKSSNIDHAVFSPRVAAIFKPLPDHAIRLSFNKAYRSPSLVNNFLDTRLLNQLNLGLINPALAGQIYTFPFHAVGNPTLSEESTKAYEIAYTGVINNRATISAALYFTKNKDEIFFTQTGRYRATAPPPAWPLPAVVLEVLPPPCVPGAPCTSGGIPSEFSYRNLGTVKNHGFEVGADGAINAAVNVFANYSYQAEPEPDFSLSEINLPPTNRFNAGFSYNKDRFLGNLSISYVGEAVWQDVLDARFAGPTDAYTQVNGAFGVRFAKNKATATLKVVNLTNEDIQSHVFGDIVKRQFIGELRLQF
jgi:outer membrane receptor protein involved in Fe transport